MISGLGELAALDAEGATFDFLARAMMENYPSVWCLQIRSTSG